MHLLLPGCSIDSKHDLDALHRFTSGRWLWNERQQLAARYLKFDITALLKLAATSIGSESCVEVVKISEGQYNKVFQLTMNDGREVIAKLPNPNAGRPHFTTASEVATMDFVLYPFLLSLHLPCSFFIHSLTLQLRNTLLLPVPKVHAWSSRASDNPVGTEYIIMEKQTGTMLSDVWETMRGKQKTRIVQQVVDLEKTLTSIKFTKLGALYYKQDLPSSNHGTVLYVDSAGNEIYTEKFGIGPTNHRSFFDFGKGELDIDRGPCKICIFTPYYLF